MAYKVIKKRYGGMVWVTQQNKLTLRTILSSPSRFAGTSVSTILVHTASMLTWFSGTLIYICVIKDRKDITKMCQMSLIQATNSDASGSINYLSSVTHWLKFTPMTKLKRWLEKTEKSCNEWKETKTNIFPNLLTISTPHGTYHLDSSVWCLKFNDYLWMLALLWQTK